MSKLLLMAALASLLVVGVVGSNSREADDRAQILKHVHGIFRAFIERDRDTIERMHTTDWVGFLGPSTGIERGIDAYMVNADRSLASFRGTGYELLDTEIQIYGDLALIYYVARYNFRDQEGREGSLPLRSIDIYCRENGHWNQCGSHITPIPSGGSWGEGSGSAPQKLSREERAEILAVREAVWIAWFANDREALERLLPEETIAIDPGVSEWADLGEVLRRAEEFHAEGAEIQRLEFPRTRIQAYGTVAIIYSDYLFEFVSEGVSTTLSGRGTEVFVKRNGGWLNSGWHLDSGG